MAQSIGDQLKQARLERGLTLEQVSQVTHIRKHYLEALENEQRELLPSPVQGRGFLRLYAGHLDLPVAAMLAAWDGKQPTTPLVGNESPGEGPGLADAAASEAVASADAAASDAASDTTNTAALAHGMVTPSSVVDRVEKRPSGSPESSQAIFREIGQLLQTQREGLGLSRAEVERFTRLRQHYIQALESGQIEHLPSPVQGRGMLSNYAKFLNMDEEKVLLRFAEGLQARRIERIPKIDPGSLPAKKRPARQAPLWRRFLTPDLIFGVAVAGIILFSALYTAARISNVRSTQSEPTPPGVAGVLLTPKADRTGTLAAALTPAGTVVGGETAETPSPRPTVTPVNDPGQEITTAEPSQTPSAGGQANDQNKVITFTPIGVVAPTVAPINNDPLQVYIVARQRAWLRVQADNKIKFLGRTVPGNAYAFSGTQQIELLTGNAAALQVFYNQTDLGVLGGTGEVVGLVFGKEGVLTPTAAFTATSTATPLASLTPLPTSTPQATPSITPFIP